MRKATLTNALFMLASLSSAMARGQHFIDLRSVGVTGEGWPPDQAAHSLIVDSVITTFDTKAPVGTVLKGIGNRPVNAFIQGDFRTELEHLLGRLRTGSDDGPHLVLKVDTLDVSERSLSTYEVASCRFSAEILQRTDSGWSRLYAFGTTLAKRGGMDATDDHAENIAHALDNCLRRTARAMGTPAATGVPVSDRQLYRPWKRRLPDIRSIADGRARSGIYYSFMDLVDNTPDTTTAFELKETGNTTETTRVVKLKGPEWDLKAWGISDGERLYVNTGREYNEVTITKDGMRTYWTPTGKEGQDAAELMAVGFMFGAIGVALAGSGSGGGAPVRLDIELDAGSLTRMYAMSTGSRDSEHWFCYSRHSGSDTTACLFMYGGEEACMGRGQYHVVKLVPRVEPVPIELQAGAARARVELDTNASTDQVYLITVKEDGTLKVDKLNPAMASDIINRADPGMEVK